MQKDFHRPSLPKIGDVNELCVCTFAWISAFFVVIGFGGQAVWISAMHYI